MNFPYDIRARRTGTALIVAAAGPAAATFVSGHGVPDLAARAADFGRY